MEVFDDYARYYDLLYRDKDYAGESAYIDGLIRHYAGGAKTILNLGCGSGKHDLYLSRSGYRLAGVDLSEKMLEAARAAAQGNPLLEYHHGDVRTIRLSRRFDVVVSLFHVISYQSTQDSLAEAFETARLHLDKRGLFIFDCWYGPGVLTDLPCVRVKELEDDATSITRIAQPAMLPEENRVDVHYRLFVRDKRSGKTSEVRETHRMRYLFLPEIALLLQNAGMALLNAHPSFTPASQPSLATWSLTVVARGV